MTRPVPSRIGRFDIERVLGSGPQGGVYLSRDGLGRAVAIRTPGGEANTRTAGDIDKALSGVRLMREVSHPNIVPVMDAGEDGGVAFAAYEYVEGELLSALLESERRVEIDRALDITIQILKGLGAAHQKGIAHGDLRPENIVLSGRDTPRLMDFGIASWQGAGVPAHPYKAPEHTAGAHPSASADLYSVAMVLYRMLTGRTAPPTGNGARTVAAPSSINPEIDERLDDLMLKALAPDPAARFDSAAKMEDALYLYLNPGAENTGTANSSAGTLDFLLRRMRHKSDFPGLSATISAINRATASDDESANTLSQYILKDFALTAKLLKMVNSAYFGSFGGTISTISKAVVIMGFDRIRNAAITLMLFEHLQNKAHAARLKEDLVASYFSGVLARQLGAKTGIRCIEEAFLCGTFHNLGRLLTSFYFPEEDREIQKLMQKGVAEPQASLQVLGVSFEDLGIGVAKVWNFPPRLIQSMRHVNEEKVEKLDTDEARLRALANFSSSVCDSMRDFDEQTREEKLKEIVKKYNGALGVNANLLASSIKHCAAELAKDAVALNLRTKTSAFIASTATAAQKTAAEETAAEIESVLEQARCEAVSAAAAEPVATDPQRKAMLFDGIQDITMTLMGEFTLNGVLREILETMYRSMGFTRVLLFVRDPGTSTLRSRFGLGDRVDDIVGGPFSISLGVTRDVFQAAVTNGADVFIENVNAESIRKHVPESYRTAIPATSFALFPIIVKGRPVGLLYGDSDIDHAIRFSTEELTLLKTLRNQAVIAIKQSA